MRSGLILANVRRLKLLDIVSRMRTGEIPVVLNDCLLRYRPLTLSDNKVICTRSEETSFCHDCAFYITRGDQPSESTSRNQVPESSESGPPISGRTEPDKEDKVRQETEFAPVSFEGRFLEIHANKQWGLSTTPAELVRSSWLKDHGGRRVKITIERLN
jgi:hypothetical protein